MICLQHNFNFHLFLTHQMTSESIDLYYASVLKPDSSSSINYNHMGKNDQYVWNEVEGDNLPIYFIKFVCHALQHQVLDAGCVGV